MTPDARIDAANSSKLLGSKVFLGWLGFGTTWSTLISMSVSDSVGVDESSAPRPRPRPRLVMSEYLRCQLEVRDSSLRTEIMKHHRFSVARSFRKSNVPRDDRFEDLSWKILLNFGADLQGQARPAVEHRQDDSRDSKAWIEPLPDELDGLE